MFFFIVKTSTYKHDAFFFSKLLLVSFLIYDIQYFQFFYNIALF